MTECKRREDLCRHLGHGEFQLDLVRIKIKRVRLEQFLELLLRRAHQRGNVTQAILIIFDVVEVLLKQFRMQDLIFNGRVGEP
ncbi:hypothetical protein D3C81_1810690 [compost metagenome]